MTDFEIVMKHNHKLSSKVLAHLSQVVGERLSTKKVDLLTYSRDYWPITLHWMLKGKLPSLPDAVVWPENKEEVEKVVKIAHESSIPIYAYGGGSGVLGGTIPEKGGIIVDLKRMRSIKLH